MDKVFGDLSPQFGFSGDEDQGLMGSLAVLMKMGLFEMKSGADINPELDITSPIFDEIIIHLNQDYFEGDQIKIIANNNSVQNKYIKKLSWNNILLESSVISHAEFVKGGTLELDLSKNPNIK